MATLIIENIPASLFEEIQRLADAQERTPSDTALEILRAGLESNARVLFEPRRPSEIFLSTEISAPCDIPWPEGQVVQAVEIPPPLPEPHDFPDQV